VVIRGSAIKSISIVEDRMDWLERTSVAGTVDRARDCWLLWPELKELQDPE